MKQLKRLRASAVLSPCHHGFQVMAFLGLGIEPHDVARPDGHGHRVCASANWS